MSKLKEIQERAKKKRDRLDRLRQDPRYRKVVGRLAAEQLLFGKDAVPTRGLPTVDEALWAGEIEPRILELLPAILFRRPKMFLCARDLPEDLDKVVRELKRGRPETPFRGIEPAKYAAWVERVGRGTAYPAVMKTHRFTSEDQRYVQKLMRVWGVGETEAIRRAVRVAADQTGA